MKAGPIVVGQLLQNRNRYKVPIYQRNYVWNREKQWEPFWSDIRTKATERLAGREQRFSHYMGQWSSKLAVHFRPGACQRSKW